MEPTQVVETAQSGHEFLHYLPIIVAGVFGIFIALERFFKLVMTYPMGNSRAFYDQLKSLVLADRLPEAIALCDRFGSKPVAKVAKQGLLSAHQPEIIVQDALQIALSEEMDHVKARTPYLATIANVATLLGLLGTILGLIQSFEAIGKLAAKDKTAALTAGISTAMNATLMGLAVAIPAMILFSYFMNKTNRLSSDLEQAAARTLQMVRQRLMAPDSAQHDSASNNHKFPRAV
jgi:biopolymer transport protein ExbB